MILDVVYNHLGPDGNYLARFAPRYFTDRYKNEWGDAINFDGPDARPVREFFVANAGYWIDEFHFDGLRLDATQSIFDASAGAHHRGHRAARRARRRRRASDRASSARTNRRTRAWSGPRSSGGYRPRRALERRLPPRRHGRPDRAQRGLLHATTTARRRNSSPPRSTAICSRASVYAGRSKRRGTPALDLAPAAFVTFLENHDQVANSGAGTALPSAARVPARCGR